jgi:hypothetical protein
MTLQWSEQYKSGYKQGVVDGTRQLGPDEKNAITTTCWPSLEVQNILDHRRKELLTRKVTKWVNVYNRLPIPYGGTSPGLSVSSTVYDTKEEAVEASKDGHGLVSVYTAGTYPIEIDELY